MRPPALNKRSTAALDGKVGGFCGQRGGVSYHGCGPNNNKQPISQTTISYQLN